MHREIVLKLKMQGFEVKIVEEQCDLNVKDKMNRVFSLLSSRGEVHRFLPVDPN